jgi:TolA-binding protein
MTKTTLATAVVLSLVCLGFEPALAATQAPASDTARKHLESGIQFYEQGRYKQALNDFAIVVSMDDSEFADDALLKIGEYYLEIEENFDQARENFDRVLHQYPTKDAAPGAYYYLGLVTLRSRFGAQAVDDSLANFQRVIRLYPQSRWVAAALFSTGVALERRGGWEQAIDSYFRVVSEYPGSRWAPGAQLGIGRCSVRLDKPMEGMIEIQRSRNRFPESPEADEALNWLTLLFRFYGLPQLGRPISFKPDPSFSPRMSQKFKDVQSVRISPSGIHLLEKGRDRVITFDHNGKLVGTKAAADPQSLTVDPRGTTVLANDKGLRIGERHLVLAIPENDGPKPLDNLRVAVRDRLGDLFVYDDSQKKVLRFNPNGELISSFPDSSRREILRLEVDRIGNLILLAKKDRSVDVYSPAGRRVAHIARRGEQWEFKKPTDIAVDPAGYFYLLDEELAQVAVFDPSYRFLTLLSSDNLSGVLKKPISLDVDGSGDIYVYDDGPKKLFRFH